MKAKSDGRDLALLRKLLNVTPTSLPGIIDEVNKLKEEGQLELFDEYLRENLSASKHAYDKGHLQLLTQKGVNLPSQDPIAVSIMVWGLESSKVNVSAYLAFLGCEMNLLSGVGFWPSLDKQSINIEFRKLVKNAAELIAQSKVLLTSFTTIVIDYCYDNNPIGVGDTPAIKHVGDSGVFEAAE